MNMAPIILMLLGGLIQTGETCERIYYGCWTDKAAPDRAIQGGVSGSVSSKDECKEMAMNNGWTFFAIQAGKMCRSSADAGETYNQYGEADEGICDETYQMGGSWANSVYKIKCDWSEWVVGECSVTCGEGTQTSTRTCEVPGACSCYDEEGCSTKTEVCTQSECLWLTAIEPELRLYKNKHPAFDYSDSEDTYITASSIENLGDKWNDETDAAWAVEGAWALYINVGYDDEITTLCPGERKHEFNYLGDKLSSVEYLREVPEECNSGKLNIYSKDNYEGESATITSNVSDLKNQRNDRDTDDFNDDINSVQAIKGYWMLYKKENYGGDGLCIQEGEEQQKIDGDYKDKVESIQQVNSC